MTKRAKQREDTRERIVEAAVGAFADLGFGGASTREIAGRASANQGLITYHFRTKEDLWRAAAERIFGQVRAHLGERLAALEALDPLERAREAIREFVRYAARHPELFHFLIEEGKSDDDRMQWLVDSHLKPLYQGFRNLVGAALPDLDAALLPHVYYVMTGAGSVIFAIAPECKHLTGVDPNTETVIERHADFVARLLVP